MRWELGREGGAGLQKGSSDRSQLRIPPKNGYFARSII